VTPFDVAVVGAGPAGAVAATLLARDGRHVALVDPGGHGGDRIGETLPAFAADLLERHGLPGPLSQAGHLPIRGTESQWGGVRTRDDAVMRPGGPDWRLDRGAFDARLRQVAVGAGAVPVADLVTSVERHGDGWKVTTDAGVSFDALRLVDASGRRGVIARMQGGARRRQNRQVAIWAVGAPMPEGTKRTSRTLIQDQAEGWWYGAVLPSGRPVVAYHTSAAQATHIRRDPDIWHEAFRAAHVVCQRLPSSLFADATLAFTDATGDACTQAAGADWAACGDAAISFDPLASQGLLHAVRTGIAMVDLMGGRAKPEQYCAEMDRVWAHYLSHHAALMARRVLV